jgi:hypothetical protein
MPRTARPYTSPPVALLVACMGHSLARPRTASVKLLNALYDGHDWGVTCECADSRPWPRATD